MIEHALDLTRVIGNNAVHRREIDVDDTTLTKYNSLNNDFANKIKSNIDFIDTPHFKLGQDERCPFLNSKGLCEIIINLGEDMLCQICSDHPRFRNYYDDFTMVKVSDFRDAVIKTSEIAQPGDIVIMSPACTSFDRFKNFAERGKLFKEIVNNL